ncbi:hypothetical protein JQ608_06945 [Bradyrhizobium liaoningense]|uniref:hypothetical protein n=1 Tax=Bradyrhizobium liaoningense TaxID=43992 RepID=UPI001BA6F556|nr:hypothetical protein [Bradyrhizobium liaoningense]MBR0876939.1 hypothetical protein [Bradyrhizobium liaoningense]
MRKVAKCKRLDDVMAEVERRGSLDILRRVVAQGSELDPVGNLSQVGLALRFDMTASTIRRRGELVTGFVHSAEGVWRETWKRTKQRNGWCCYDRVRVEGHPRQQTPRPHQVVFKAAMRRGKPELIFVGVLDQHGREMEDSELGWIADGDHEALELEG